MHTRIEKMTELLAKEILNTAQLLKATAFKNSKVNVKELDMILTTFCSPYPVTTILNASFSISTEKLKLRNNIIYKKVQCCQDDWLASEHTRPYDNVV